MTKDQSSELINLLFRYKIEWIDGDRLSKFKQDLSRSHPATIDDMLFSMLKVSINGITNGDVRPMLDYMLDKALSPTIIAKWILFVNCLVSIRRWVVSTMSDRLGHQHQIQPPLTALQKLNKCFTMITLGL